jgi:tetratricopeptide (TPR) repeat protein
MNESTTKSRVLSYVLGALFIVCLIAFAIWVWFFSPISTVNQNSAAEVELNHGVAAYKRGDMKVAINQATKAIELNPNYTDAYNNRGNAYAALGNKSRAIADYSQAIKLNPNDALAYNNRGVAYYDLGDYKGASEDARKACELGNCKLLEFMATLGYLRD